MALFSGQKCDFCYSIDGVSQLVNEYTEIKIDFCFVSNYSLFKLVNKVLVKHFIT